MKPHLANENCCTGCAACADSCHHHALRMEYDKNGFLRPVVNSRLCIGCGVCEKTCPILNYEKLPFHEADELHHFAAWSKDEDVCRNSSSGGIFTQLAIDLLGGGNAVAFGAESSNDNTCHHQAIKQLEDLPRIAGTKYIQSNAEGSYKEARKALQQNLKVLFCGTPCQIAALYAILGKGRENPNLYTAELICHGVSGKVTADIATRYVGADHIHTFRDKQEGWCKPGLIRVSQKNTYFMPDGTLYRPDKNLFWGCFATSHRISCTRCPFARLPRLADISLGDLWGLYKQYPERGELGASLVLANSAKGLQLMSHESITTIEHPKSQLNCYTVFYPGASRHAQLSSWLHLIKKLPTRTAYHILLLDWKKNPLLIPIKAWFGFVTKKHVEHTLQSIKNTKKRLKWE